MASLEKQNSQALRWSFRTLFIILVVVFSQCFIVYELTSTQSLHSLSFFSSNNTAKLAVPGTVPGTVSGTAPDMLKDDSSQFIQVQPRDSKSLLNSPGIRVVLVIAAIVVLNMAAICIHHIYLKIARSSVSYKSIELNIGPF